MMRAGRSFSGRERNCLFLNTGNPSGDSPRFADISASSGVDYPDDGRGVAIVDWDADGDLDMWISNRNAPRVRLMRNDTPSENHFVAFRLQGNGSDTNRDAIGARVEVFLENNQTGPLLKTLRAGEGFISQSSKWLHFGLGAEDRIARVEVRWPSAKGLAGEKESFSNVTADGRFRLVQGRSEAESLSPRSDTLALKPGAAELPKPSGTIRAPSVSLFRFPTARFQRADTKEYFTTGENQAVLINLWGSWCSPCRAELKEFAARADELRQAGLEVVALTVDSVDKENGNVPAAKQFITSFPFPFAARPVLPNELEVLHAFDSELTTLNRPLPIPSSFLLDRNGHVAVIYKGRVGVDQLLEDINFSQRSLPERWLAAAPLGGSLIDHEKVAATARTHEATALYRYALKQLGTGQLQGAAYHLNQAVTYRPDFAVALDHLGSTYAKLGQLQRARRSLEAAVASDPQLASAHFNLAMAYVQEGNQQQALLSLRNAIRVDPDATFEKGDLAPLLSQDVTTKAQGLLINNIVQLHRQVAWLMATSRDDEMLDGDEAVRWAKRLVEATKRSQPEPLWTLASAYAEVGRFEEAVSTAKEAQGVLERSPAKMKPEYKKLLLDRLQDQIDLFEQGKPYRNPIAG